jgi:PAS domain S-box-containing protein
MDLLVLTTVLGLSVTVFTAGFVLGRNPQHPVNRTFFFMGIFCCIWGAGILMRYNASTAPEALAFYSVAMFGAMATTACFARFAIIFLRDLLGGRLPPVVFVGLQAAVYATGGALFLAIPFTDFVAQGVRFAEGHPLIYTGMGFNLIVVWGVAVCLISSGMILLFRRRMAEEIQRKQALLVALSPLVPAVGFAVMELVFSATSTGRLVGESYFVVSFFAIFIAYGVHRLGLMTITPGRAAEEILEGLPDGLVLLDTMGRIRNANPAFLDLVGETPDVVVGRSIWDFIRAREGAVSGPAPSFESTTRTDMRLETRTAGGGDPVPVNATVKPVYDPREERVGTIMVFRDLRPLRRLEAELVQAEKLGSLGQLAAGVAHEMNNPLTVILGLSELGGEEIEEGRTAGHFHKIRDQVLRSKRIVSKLLQFARKSGGRTEVCDLHGILDEVTELMEMGGAVQTVSVRKIFADGPLWCECDPEQIRQVFFNILQNAFQAVDESGREGRVVVRTSRGEGTLRVEVEDSGRGIPREVLPRIFDPFFTTKDPGRGTGLGLSICHGIVTKQGGRIQARSEREAGTTLIVELGAGSPPPGDGSPDS